MILNQIPQCSQQWEKDLRLRRYPDPSTMATWHPYPFTLSGVSAQPARPISSKLTIEWPIDHAGLQTSFTDHRSKTHSTEV